MNLLNGGLRVRSCFVISWKCFNNDKNIRSSGLGGDFALRRCTQTFFGSLGGYSQHSIAKPRQWRLSIGSDSTCYFFCTILDGHDSSSLHPTERLDMQTTEGLDVPSYTAVVIWGYFLLLLSETDGRTQNTSVCDSGFFAFGFLCGLFGQWNQNQKKGSGRGGDLVCANGHFVSGLGGSQ